MECAAVVCDAIVGVGDTLMLMLDGVWSSYMSYMHSSCWPYWPYHRRHKLIINGIAQSRCVDDHALFAALREHGPRDHAAVGQEVYDERDPEAWLWCDAHRLLVRTEEGLRDNYTYNSLSVALRKAAAHLCSVSTST